MSATVMVCRITRGQGYEGLKVAKAANFRIKSKD